MSYTEWRTPKRLFDPLAKVETFAVDAAADQDNHLCDLWYGPGGECEDALAVAEWASPAWCNPPYGAGLESWLAKFAEQQAMGKTVIALLPAYTDRQWWKKWIVGGMVDVVFLVGRVPFEKPCGTCYGSVTARVTCETCAGTGLDPKATHPRDASALALYHPAQAGQVTWLDWKRAQ